MVAQPIELDMETQPKKSVEVKGQEKLIVPQIAARATRSIVAVDYVTHDDTGLEPTWFRTEQPVYVHHRGAPRV